MAENRYELNKQLAQMLKGGVIMDVTTPEQAKIAEAAGACAGLILLAAELGNDDRRWFQTLPVTVKRNAYGRQLGSFHTDAEFEAIGEIPMTFIRAPYIETVLPEVKVMAKVDERIVGVRYKQQLAISFHPELDGDNRLHQYFAQMVSSSLNKEK